MLYKLYSIVDTVAEEYGPLFQAKNDGVAIRNFKQFLSKNQVDPSEAELWYIADYDSETGKLFDGSPGVIEPIQYIDCRFNIMKRITTETETDE